jgi:hypothetical protein
MPAAIDTATRRQVTDRIIAHVKHGWPRLGTPIVRFRGGFCYVDAVLPGRSQPTPILRLRYQDRPTSGTSASGWPATNATPSPSYPDRSDPAPEPRKRASTTPSSSTQDHQPTVEHVEPHPPKPQNCETRDTVRPHRSLDLQAPRAARPLTLVEPATAQSLVERVDVLGGLIHEYRLAA